MNGKIKGEKRQYFERQGKKKISIRNKGPAETARLRGLHWRVLLALNSPFPKHSPHHPIFGFFLFKLLHFWGFSFYTILWFLQSSNYARFCIKTLWEGYYAYLWQKYYKQDPQKVPWMPHLRSWWVPPFECQQDNEMSHSESMAFKRCHLLSKGSRNSSLRL